MVSEHWSRIVTASVTPVVVISACSLLCLAYNRLASIVSRLRGFQRERLHEQEEIHHVSRGILQWYRSAGELASQP